jgi:hypothetical protein
MGLALGKEINYGERYGLENPLSRVFRDASRRWKTEDPYVASLETALGASGAIGGDILKTVFSSHFSALYEPEYASKEVLIQDAKEVARRVSSFNQGYNTYAALMYGARYSRNMGLQDDSVSVAEGIWEGLTGLSPQHISDGYRMLQIRDEQKKRKNAIYKDLAPLTAAYLQAAKDQNQEAMVSIGREMHFLIVGAGFVGPEVARVKRNLLQQDTLFESVLDSILKDQPANSPMRNLK